MAFSATLTKRQIAGPFKWKFYAFTNTAGSTGGVIETGLKRVYATRATHEVTEGGSTIRIERDTDAGGASNGSVQITTVADEDGTILIVGK